MIKEALQESTIHLTQRTMAEELLSLKWNNHQTHFVDILTFLREQEIFIDATLACGGKLYPAHKFVLSTCSDYFKQMFTKNPSKHPIVFMKDVSCRDLEALLDFMYNGEVNVPQSSLGSLIKTAEGLQIKGLAVPDDPPLSKRDIPPSLPRERRDYKVSRDNSYSPPAKRARAREKSPPVLGPSASPFSSATLPKAKSPGPVAGLISVAGGLLPIDTGLDEDSRTSAHSALSDHHSPTLNNKTNVNNSNSQTHLNSEDSAGHSDNVNASSSKEPSPGPSGIHHKHPQSKEEELDIKQEDVVDLGDADDGNWGGGDGEGRDGSMDDGGGDSLASESNPNFADVLGGSHTDGSLNTTGDPAMRNGGVNGGGAAVMTTSTNLSSLSSTLPRFDSHLFPSDDTLPPSFGAGAGAGATASTSTTTSTIATTAGSSTASLSPLGLDLSSSVYRFLLESSTTGNSVGVGGNHPRGNPPQGTPSLSVTSIPPHALEDADQRPFPCKFCEARFKKKQHLQNHERIHTGEKYLCILCGQGFSRLHILKHHIARKHNVPDTASAAAVASSMVQHN